MTPVLNQRIVIVSHGKGIKIFLWDNLLEKREDHF
jgi:hypothetical protein